MTEKSDLGETGPKDSPELSTVQYAKAGGEVLSERAARLTSGKKSIWARVGKEKIVIAGVLAISIFNAALFSGIIQRERFPIDHKGITIHSSLEGLPKRYTFRDGRVQIVDYAKAQEVRERAIKNKEPEILDVLVTPSLESPLPFTPSPEHPRIVELPKDVLPEEELKTKGIEIIQSPKTNLYIRESAFKEGGIFESFNSGQSKLAIVLVDGPVISTRYMHDSRYGQAREIIGKYFPDDEKSQLEKITEIEKTLVAQQSVLAGWEGMKGRIEDIASQKKDGKRVDDFQEYFYNKYKDLLTPSILEEVKSEIVRLKTERELYSGADEALLERLLVPGNPLGLFVGSRDELNPYRGDSMGKPIIFVCTGKESREGHLETVTTFFNTQGKLDLFDSEYAISGSADLTPRSHQTFPNPADIKMEPNSKPGDHRIKIGVQEVSPGLILAHELGHWQLDEAALGQTEGGADEQLLKRFSEVWNKFKASGFKNDPEATSGYPFVFSILQEYGGGYVITENKKDGAKA